MSSSINTGAGNKLRARLVSRKQKGIEVMGYTEIFAGGKALMLVSEGPVYELLADENGAVTLEFDCLRSSSFPARKLVCQAIIGALLLEQDAVQILIEIRSARFQTISDAAPRRKKSRAAHSRRRIA